MASEANPNRRATHHASALEALTAAARERILVLDGAMGTQIQGLGFDEDHFRGEWTSRVAALRFDELNDLIDHHNRWYPAESRLPMDPRTGDYALVNGRDYRLEPFDAGWVLERFPAELSSAPVSVP